MCRISHDQILIYEAYPTGGGYRSERQIENERNLTRGDYNGYMSPKTKAKVKKYLATWVDSVHMIRNSPTVQKRLDRVPLLTFVTLTLPAKQEHPDNEIKRKLLTPYIATLQRKYGVEHYFWRAEAQANGNIHFHLIVDSFVEWRAVRDDWNRCVNKLGYVDRFEAVHGHRDPNSTDIHGLGNVRSVASYVIKYCCKEDGYRPIEGRIHGCSDGLRSLTPYEDYMVDNELPKFVENAMNDDQSTIIEKEDFTIIKCSTKKMLQKYSPKTYKKVVKHKINSVFQLYCPEPPEIVTEYRQKIERKRLIQLELFS